MPSSYWETTTLIGRPDLVIIGSGIVGLTAALHYRELHPDADILILEKSPLPAGGSTRNAGFACFGSMTELLEDLQHHTEQEVMDLLAKRWAGLKRLRGLIGDKTLHYQAVGNYELFGGADDAIFDACQAKMDDLNRLVAAAIGEKEVFRLKDEKVADFGFAAVNHLIFNRAEGMLHTGLMMQALLQKAHRQRIRILNGVAVAAWTSTPLYVDLQLSTGWQLKASRMIVATNGFARQLLPDLAVRPARNLVLITHPIPDLKFNSAFHANAGYYYFRAVDNRILLGGGRHLDAETETTTAFGENPIIKSALEKMLHQVILPRQTVAIDQWWSGILGVGPQKKPIVARIDDRVAVAVRMGGMGVAIGSGVGAEAAKCFGNRKKM